MNPSKDLTFIVTKLSNVGIVKSNHETNLQFLNGLGGQWTTTKMVIQGASNIKTLSLYKLYGELQAKESMAMKQCVDLGGPLALIV